MMVIFPIYSLEPATSPLKAGLLRGLSRHLACMDPLYLSPRFTPEDSAMQVAAHDTTHDSSGSALTFWS